MNPLPVASPQRDTCSSNFVWRLARYVRHAHCSRMALSGLTGRQDGGRFPVHDVPEPAAARRCLDKPRGVSQDFPARCTGVPTSDTGGGPAREKKPLQMRRDAKPRHRMSIVPVRFRTTGVEPAGKGAPGTISLHAGRSMHGRAISRHAKRGRRRIAACAVSLGLAMVAPGAARASDWGCQVILCLSNPGGPEQYSECVPPIERLWRALRHGDPFPACDFGAGGSQGTSAGNTFANAGYCREDLLYWGGPERSELLCRASGAINVDINGQLYTRVWWDAGGPGATVTEFYGAGSTQMPYDPTQSARLFQQRMELPSESGGGH